MQGAGLRYWSSADKGTEYTQAFDLGGAVTKTVWVEARLGDNAPRQHVITLQFRGSDQVLQTVDQIKLTVYKVDGAMNVPGYSMHTYSASVPGGTPRFAAGNMATTVTAGNPVAHPNLPINTVTAQVLWGAGADVGVYRVYPTADNNFWIDRQVNVVKVEFSAAAAGDNELKFTNPPSQSTVYKQLIFSSTLGNAMEANLRVTKIEGPSVGGSMRGVRFVEIGLVQNGTFTKKRSDYDGFAPKQSYVSSLEGQSYLDTITDPPAMASTLPWYDSKAHSGTRGLYTPGVDPLANAPIVNILLNASDTPQLTGHDQANLKLTVNGTAKDADRFVLLFDLKLYLAVRTKEAVLDSGKVYTQRAKTGWHFDGSGEFTVPTVWVKTGVGNVKGTSDGTDNTGAFTEVNDGSVVPLTTAPVLNNQLAVQTWTPRNQ